MSEVLENDWIRFDVFSKNIAHLMGERMLRDVISERETNGATHFCKKPRGFLYLSPSRFYEWIEKEGKV